MNGSSAKSLRKLAKRNKLTRSQYLRLKKNWLQARREGTL